MHDMDLTSGQGLTHLYYKGEVLWPFGFGLSYVRCHCKQNPLPLTTAPPAAAYLVPGLTRAAV